MKKNQKKSIQLAKSEVSEIMTRLSGVIDNELTEMCLGINVYRLIDDSVLIALPSGKGILYPSRQKALETWNKLATTPPQHSLAGRLLHEREFPDRVEELIERLSVHLGLTPSVLDRSRKSLSNIDKAIRKLGAKRCLKADIFSGLTAYVGETARNIGGGKWEMRLAADNKTWEPWIVTGDGKHFAPFLIVFRELYEPGGSIQGAFLL